MSVYNGRTVWRRVRLRPIAEGVRVLDAVSHKLPLTPRPRMDSGVIPRRRVSWAGRLVLAGVEESDDPWLLTEPWMAAMRRYRHLHAYVVDAHEGWFE